jgi:two-component system response regulator RegA
VSEEPTLLLVDDDEVFRTRLGRALEARGFVVTLCGSATEAQAHINDTPEFAVIDLRIGTESGLDVLRALKAQDAQTVVVMLTGYGSIPTAIEATKRGATGYLTKPIEPDAVVRALRGQDAGSAEIETPSLARTEWEHIHRVLADVGGNVSEAARRLGLHRRSLQRKLKKYPPSR